MEDVTANLQRTEKQIHYHDIAAKLLNDHFLLTALELHSELVEAGKEIKILKDYFSNPVNFERQPQENRTQISRSGSQVTLDSLDCTRFSEDGERSVEERVAVLEFELRKARETISALRNNLTVATELEMPLKIDKKDVIKPHEQRALNFLINEYLLTYGYKLTSITFADENENQDFEDWDDVGLNVPKPAELLFLYREGLKQTHQNCLSSETQTDFKKSNEEIEENKKLLSLIQELNTKIVELNNKLIEAQNENVYLSKKSEQPINKNADLDDFSKNVSSNSSKVSVRSSNSLEHFEIISGSSPIIKKSEVIDDNISQGSLNENDWTKVVLNSTEYNKTEKDVNEGCENDFFNCLSLSRQLPSNFKKEILKICLINMHENVEHQNIVHEQLVQVLSNSLLRIIPNIILNKREEVIPLLVTAIHLNSNNTERDKLLQQLFNLKKKPSQEERNLILLGIVRIAKLSGEEMVENEILPQCWEQLTHKYIERRMLVVESCIALMPYVSSPIRNSLILSMLQQMLEDKEENVREIVVRALSLIVALCDDMDKYWQFEELALRTLNDSSDKVKDVSLLVLYPILAQWALCIHRLHSDLIKKLLYEFNKHLKQKETDSYNNMSITALSALDHLIPFVFICVANNKNVLKNIENYMKIDIKARILEQCTVLTNPNNFCNDKINVGMIFYEFDNFFLENVEKSWPELEWFLDIVLPDLINNLNHVDAAQHVLLEKIIEFILHICTCFGKNFTKHKIFPVFHQHICNLEQILSSYNQYSMSLSIISIYLVSVLSCCEDTIELSSALKRFVFALPLCGTPLDCLEVGVKGLCHLGYADLVVACLWDGVMHQRPLVRAATANLFAIIIRLCNEHLLTTKITPALVTLANDSDLLVRTATLPALGTLITNCNILEVHDKAYMQIQSSLSEPVCKENHALLRQMVVTLGNIVNNCKASFRDEVIIIQLSSLSAYTYQMTNQTRKIDMVLALLEAFSNVIYSPLNKGIITSTVLPGLKYLEVIILENSTLTSHSASISSMIKEFENRVNSFSSQSAFDRTGNALSQNVNNSVEDVKQRVSKIFQKPSSLSKQNTLPNIQAIFKKK